MTKFGVTKGGSASKGASKDAGPEPDASRRPLFYRHDDGERSRRLTRVPAAGQPAAVRTARQGR